MDRLTSASSNPVFVAFQAAMEELNKLKKLAIINAVVDYCLHLKNQNQELQRQAAQIARMRSQIAMFSKRQSFSRVAGPSFPKRVANGRSPPRQAPPPAAPPPGPFIVDELQERVRALSQTVELLRRENQRLQSRCPLIKAQNERETQTVEPESHISQLPAKWEIDFEPFRALQLEMSANAQWLVLIFLQSAHALCTFLLDGLQTAGSILVPKPAL